MSSDVSMMDGPWQLKCSSVELTANGPNVVANQIQITQNEMKMDPMDPDPMRPGNHPSIASDGENVVLMYGSDKMVTGITQTYASVLDHMCQVKVAPFR